jgi:hypothetical protein
MVRPNDDVVPGNRRPVALVWGLRAVHRGHGDIDREQSLSGVGLFLAFRDDYRRVGAGSKFGKAVKRSSLTPAFPVPSDLRLPVLNQRAIPERSEFLARGSVWTDSLETANVAVQQPGSVAIRPDAGWFSELKMKGFPPSLVRPAGSSAQISFLRNVVGGIGLNRPDRIERVEHGVSVHGRPPRLYEACLRAFRPPRLG